MRYYSTRDLDYFVSAKQAILTNLCPKGGLFVPEKIPLCPNLVSSSEINLAEIGFEVAKTFLSTAFNEEDLREMCNRAFNFDAPLVNLDSNLSVLELTHGPSLAFKDFGARFMAECLSRLAAQDSTNYQVLTATSGDTGGAVAAALYDKENVNVTILFPKGRISKFQEAQMTKWGKNIRTVAVEGSFDDCQRLVKKAFSKWDLGADIRLISANSINISRLLAQMVYYLSSLIKLKDKKDLVFVVPCGNLGNLTAGIWAADFFGSNCKFIAAHNQNSTFPEYLTSGAYSPMQSIATLSNAMDVGSPSNFERIEVYFKSNLEEIKNRISAVVVSDPETLEEIRAVYSRYKYFACPHTAVALSAAKKVEGDKVVLATAHPKKFAEVLELAGVPFNQNIIDEKISTPSYSIKAEYNELVKILHT